MLGAFYFIFGGIEWSEFKHIGQNILVQGWKGQENKIWKARVEIRGLSGPLMQGPAAVYVALRSGPDLWPNDQ
jgi:hypothetical protein